MKKLLALVLAVLMLLSLCACGKSEAVIAVETLIAALEPITAESEEEILNVEAAYDALSPEEQELVENYGILDGAWDDLAAAVIADFEAFAAENPYPCAETEYTDINIRITEYANRYRIDMDTIRQYQDWLLRLEEVGANALNCEHYEYAEAVVSLAAYEQVNEFLKCYYTASDTIAAAFTDMESGMNAQTLGNTDLAFSFFNSAASNFQGAETIANGLDPEAENIADFAACMKLMSSGATNTATGLYLSSPLLVEIGTGTLTEQTLILQNFMTEALTLEEEISALEEEIQNNY